MVESLPQIFQRHPIEHPLFLADFAFQESSNRCLQFLAEFLGNIVAAFLADGVLHLALFAEVVLVHDSRLRKHKWMAAHLACIEGCIGFDGLEPLHQLWHVVS
jgi:hypothetical protein